MSKRSVLASGAMAVAVGVMTLGAAASASAQPYNSYAPSYSNYDPCERDASGRGVGGALLGGGLGAVMGSQVAARGHRTDGSVLGGLVGAIAGGVIGHKSAACNNAPPQPRGQMAYSDAPPPPPYVDEGYDGRGGYYRHEHYRVSESPPNGPDGCTLAESQIHMPDGSTQRRFVKVCLDHDGRYQVVD